MSSVSVVSQMLKYRLTKSFEHTLVNLSASHLTRLAKPETSQSYFFVSAFPAIFLARDSLRVDNFVSRVCVSVRTGMMLISRDSSCTEARVRASFLS